MGRMKVVCALVIFSAALAGCAVVRGTVRVEQAPAGQPYDFAVHVKNSAEIGYNPEVSSDRAGTAVPVGNSILQATDIESGDAPALCERFVA
jgi:hypothetical protein